MLSPQRDEFTDQSQVFNLSRPPIDASFVMVFMGSAGGSAVPTGALLMQPNVDYTVVGQTLKFLATVPANPIVQVFYFAS